MYAFLCHFFAPRIAVVLLGTWYAFLILLIALFGATPETTIRYVNL
jgi:hypothetical protein